MRERLAGDLCAAREQVQQEARRHGLRGSIAMDRAIKAAVAETPPPAPPTLRRYLHQVRRDFERQRLPADLKTTVAGYQMPRSAWRAVLLAHAADLRLQAERARRAGDPQTAIALTAEAFDHVTARELVTAAGRQVARKPGRRSARYRAPPPPAAAVVLGWQLARHPAAVRHGLALLVLGATGCRPCELDGATVERRGAGLRITLRGAKVNAQRGQPVRRLTIAAPEAGRGLPLTPAATVQMLADAVPDGGRVALHYSAADVRSLRRALPPGVCPYSYRHAMGSALKAAAVPPAQAAAVMGHRSTGSLLPYGRRRRGGGHGPIPRAVAAVEPRYAAMCRPRPAAPAPQAVPRFAPPAGAALTATPVTARVAGLRASTARRGVRVERESRAKPPFGGGC